MEREYYAGGRNCIAECITLQYFDPLNGKIMKGWASPSPVIVIYIHSIQIIFKHMS